MGLILVAPFPLAGPWPCCPYWGLTSPGPFCCFIATPPLRNTHHVLNTEAKNSFLVSLFLDVSMLCALLISGYFRFSSSHSFWDTYLPAPPLLYLPEGWPICPSSPMRVASPHSSAHGLYLFATHLFQIHLFLQMLKGPARGAPADRQRNVSLCLTATPWLLSFCLPVKFSLLPLLHPLKSDPSFKALVTHCPITRVSE